MFGVNEFIFHHDIFLLHTAKFTKELFWENKIPVLDESANCPDANPLENLRRILQRRLRKYHPRNLEEFKRLIIVV